MQYMGKSINNIDESQEKIIKYANEHTKVINEMILFSDYNSNLVGNIVEHTNYLANVLRGSSLADGNAEAATDRDITGNVEKITESKAEVIAEKKECDKDDKKDKKKDKKEEKVEETKGNNITDKVDSLIATIEKDRVENVLENRYPFLKLITEEDKKTFYNTKNDLKAKIVATLESSAYFNRDDVLTVMNAVINEEVAELPNYIKYMPTKFKEVYENMNDGQKNQLQRISESGIYNQNTPYQVKFFWESQDFSGVKTQIDNEKSVTEKADEANKNLNEGQSKEGFIEVAKLNEAKRGYSNDYLANLRNFAANRS